MRIRLVVIVVACILVSSGTAIGQEQPAGVTTSSLSADLIKEEQLLASTAVVGPNDVARMDRLVTQARSVGDSQLLVRAELLLALSKDRESSKAKRDAFNASIAAEVKTLRGHRWHRTKEILVKTGLWTGLSSLGLVGAAQVVGGWAADRFLQSSTSSAAAPFLITGEVSRLTTMIGAATAVVGLGTAWLLTINPFDIPVPPALAGLPAYPRADMTVGEKISYLNGVRKDYLQRQGRASQLRNISFAFLAAGLTGVLAAGISSYLGNIEYARYTTDPTAAGAATHQQTAQIYQYITIGSGSLAFLGLSGATVGYILGPDPTSLASSIQALDRQLATLQAEQQR